MASNPELFTGLLFFHSLLRWLILITVSVAGFAALNGWLRERPVIVWQRLVAIWAMILCLVQLALGAVIYGLRLDVYRQIGGDYMRFWKLEHPAMMILAIILIVAGRLASKQARTERGKHTRVAIFYLLALILMLTMTPWPITDMGEARGWL